MSEPGPVTTIFLVDDDPGVLKALSRVLREEGWDVECFGSADTFLASAERHAQGCLVLDVSMPGLDGLALQQRLAAEGQTLPIVFVTGLGDIPMSVKAIKAGASDFLTKPVQAQALVAAIHAAIAQDRLGIDAYADVAKLQQRLKRLTLREREVLAALTAGKRNKEIAYDLGVVEQTVKFHRARIMERMEAENAAELMHMAARLGIGIPSAGTDSAAPLNGGASKRPENGTSNPKASS
jgi:FixJ family two-component response regulator